MTSSFLEKLSLGPVSLEGKVKVVCFVLQCFAYTLPFLCQCLPFSVYP